MNPHLIQQAIERTLVALTIATTKPSPRGDSSGGGGAIEPPLPLPVGLISAKRELRDILLLWVDLVSDGMDVVANCDPTERDMLTWLAGNERATFLATHDAATDFLDELTTVTKQLENPYMPKRIRTYLGDHGGAGVYVKEGQERVELADGTTVPVMEIRDTNTEMLLKRTGTAREISNIIKAYFKIDLDPKKIKDAERHDRKKPEGSRLEHITVSNGAYVYRVGDVLDRMVKKEKTTKT